MREEHTVFPFRKGASWQGGGWTGRGHGQPLLRGRQEEQAVTWIRLLVSRVRPAAADASLRMLPLPSAESACSMPSSSWVTVATHSSLAAASPAFTICCTASCRATSEHSKHCRWSWRRSRESCTQEGARGAWGGGALTCPPTWPEDGGQADGAETEGQARGREALATGRLQACGLGPVCNHGVAGHQPGSCQKGA